MTFRGMVCWVLAALMLGMAGCAGSSQKVTRFGWVTQVRPEKIAYYKDLHAHPWPAVSKRIAGSRIRNYSIYLREVTPGQYYLFSYLEYTGDDWEGDMKKMEADPETQRWWKETDPCQQRIQSAAPDDKIWSTLQEVFHQD